MRIDEKQVDGPDLERQEEQEETLLNEQREEAELPEMAVEEVRDVAQDRHGQLLTAMRMIVEHKHLNVTHLRLPQREALALEALQAAVSGRSTNMDKFVYAADRRSMLEQALAILQPNLVGDDKGMMDGLREEFDNLTKRVGELRTELINLEDAQDELLEMDKVRAKEGTPADTADKPKPTPSDPDAPRPASTLAKGGPEAKRDETKTSLSTGPEAKRVQTKTTLFDGPEANHEEKATSLTTGPEAKREETKTTLLGGPEVKRAAPATTLGDPAEIEAEAKKKPWWRNG